ncbi:MAG: GAF domain-containing sensor histidine kinase, partial [Chloroflexota bacterium]
LEILANQAATVISQTQTLSFLNEILNHISSATDISTTLQAITEGATELTHTSWAVIRLIENNNGNYIVTGTFQYPRDFNAVMPRLSRNQGVTYSVITTGKIFTTSDISTDERVNPYLREMQVQSLIVAPLLIDNVVIGALYLYDYKKREFTTREQYLLMALADQAAIALKKASDSAKLNALNEASRRASTTLLQRLKDHSSNILQLMADEIKNIAKATWVTVNIVNEDGNLYQTTISGSSLVPPQIRTNGHSRYVMKTKSAVFIRDVFAYSGKISINPEILEKDVKTILCLPLLVDGSSIGVVWLYFDKDDSRVFSDSDISPLQDYVNQAAYIYNIAVVLQRNNDITEHVKSRSLEIGNLFESLSFYDLSKSNAPIQHFWNQLTRIFPEICDCLDTEYGMVLYHSNTTENNRIHNIFHHMPSEGISLAFDWKSISSNQQLSILNGYQLSKLMSLTPDDKYLPQIFDRKKQVAVLIFRSSLPSSEPKFVMIFAGHNKAFGLGHILFEDQENLFRSISFAITDYYHAALRLEEKNRLDNAIVELYYHLGHEIGTPMIGLIAAANAMAEGLEEDQGNFQPIAKHILEQANKLYLLSETMLASVGNPPSPNSNNFVIHNLMRPLMDAIEMFEGEAKFKQCDILEPKGQFPSIYMSLHDLTIAFKNLISNAVKYSYYPSSPEQLSKRFIIVRGYWLNNEQSRFAIEIQNYGVGITEEEIKSRSIFQPFSRGVNSGDRLRTGKGLGLAQVEHAIRVIHKGEILVESIPQEGSAYLTTFKVILPISQD